VGDLVALAMPGGARFVAALQRVWDAGDAAFPLDLRLPRATRHAVLTEMAPSRLVDADGATHRLGGGRPVEPGDAVVVATSGSTGAAKGVVLTHDAVGASADATSRRLAVDAATDHWLACLPLAHIGGLSVVMRALVTRTALTVLPGPEPDMIAATEASLVSLVPTMLARIDARRFRVIVLGGSTPPATVPANVITTYGLTETGSGVVYDGTPLDGVEIRIDADGEVWLRGPMLLRAYRDGRDPKTPDGWLPSGDMGAWHDGRLVVHGRRGDMIVSGGENVWPEPVERTLARHPQIAEVAIAGRVDDEWGQRVVAFVVPASAADPPSLASLRDHVKEELPAWCAPREVVLVEALPRTNLGKVRRADLPSMGRRPSPT
jgi:O-succinylbenzoic acid--CoA ligase